MRRLLAVLALASTLACGDSDASTAAPKPTVEGLWTLITVNGAPLPYTLSGSGANKLEVISNKLSITSDGRFTSAYTQRTTTNGQQSTKDFTDVGSYTAGGTGITMKPDGGATIGGVLSGNTLTVNVFSAVYAYTK